MSGESRSKYRPDTPRAAAVFDAIVAGHRSPNDDFFYELTRCTATTTRKQQCKNLILNSQFWVHHWETNEPVGDDGAWDLIEDGVCGVHGRKPEGRLTMPNLSLAMPPDFYEFYMETMKEFKKR